MDPFYILIQFLQCQLVTYNQQMSLSSNLQENVVLLVKSSNKEILL